MQVERISAGFRHSVAMGLRMAVALLRPWFWLPAVGPAVAGYLYVGGWPSNFQFLGLVLVMALGVAGPAELFNEVADTRLDKAFFQRRAWGVNSSGNVGVIKCAAITSDGAIRLGIILLLVGAVVALAISYTFFLLTLTGQALALTYSLPPVRLKRFPLGGIGARFLGYGIVAFAAGVGAAQGSLSYDVILIGAAAGLVVAGFSSTADLADRETDVANGIRTLAVSLGICLASRIYVLLIVLGMGALFVLAVSLGTGGERPVLWLLLGLFLGAGGLFSIKEVLLGAADVARMSRLHLVGLVLESVAPFIVVL
jgi:4-hydroxybenzoate polyprenyltransferase